MTGYVHGKTTTVISVAELRRLKANQRAKPALPKTAALMEQAIIDAPGYVPPPDPPASVTRHWDKARMQDAQIKRCGTCGDWTWRGKCKVPHEVLARGEAA